MTIKGIPLHQLTNSQTKVWLLGGDFRSHIAAHFLKEHPSGYGVVAWRGQLIAYVNPRGAVRELAPPFQRIDRREVANQPKPVECACAGYYDPEVQGPWRERNVEGHHPFCQFHKFSHEVFNKVLERSMHGQLRPDEHMREVERIMGTRGEKTGIR
jgi:hypothetical protein